MVSKSKKELLAIIIPMFNEAHVANLCIDAVIKAINKIHVSSLLIVIDDGSSDKTAEILKGKSIQYKKILTVLTHKKNQGYGKATQTGIIKAKTLGATWVLHMDSDLTNDPKYIASFVTFMRSDYDCIKASRYIRNGTVKNVSLYRKVVSIIGNSIASFFFGVGIKDCTNGFRMVRMSKLKGIHFQENDFSIILEELYYLKKARAKFIEIPYILTARVNSGSHFTYRPKIFFNYFKYALKSAFSA